MNKFKTVSVVSVVRARQGWICSASDCLKEIRAGKPAVKIGKTTLHYSCAEKQGYHGLHITFEVEPDYIISEGSSIVEVCADCGREIPIGATHFYRQDGEDKGTRSCEECGVKKRGYTRPQKHGRKKEQKEAGLSKNPLKAGKQMAKRGN